MSTLFYNGITLRPIYTEACRRAHIYDGPTYLYTRWIIRVRGVFNPFATSYDAQFSGVTSPVGTQGFNAAWTDNSVRLMLSQPQGGLFYTAAGEGLLGQPLVFLDGAGGHDLTILQVPPVFEGVNQNQAAGGKFTDANNGPFPLECNVREIVGTKTFNVDFTVKADVNECYRVFSSPAFVLSNRWQMTHDIDEHAFTTRHVEGRAIFRTDMMLFNNIKPDDYRAAFAFPCPTNFKRQGVTVSLNRDGNELLYSFTDVEQSHNIIASKVTKIEAMATISVGQGTAEDAIIGFGKGVAQLLAAREAAAKTAAKVQAKNAAAAAKNAATAAKNSAARRTASAKRRASASGQASNFGGS